MAEAVCNLCKKKDNQLFGIHRILYNKFKDLDHRVQLGALICRNCISGLANKRMKAIFNKNQNEIAEDSPQKIRSQSSYNDSIEELRSVSLHSTISTSSSDTSKRRKSIADLEDNPSVESANFSNVSKRKRVNEPTAESVSSTSSISSARIPPSTHQPTPPLSSPSDSFITAPHPSVSSITAQTVPPSSVPSTTVPTVPPSSVSSTAVPPSSVSSTAVPPPSSVSSTAVPTVPPSSISSRTEPSVIDQREPVAGPSRLQRKESIDISSDSDSEINAHEVERVRQQFISSDRRKQARVRVRANKPPAPQNSSNINQSNTVSLPIDEYHRSFGG